MARICCGSSGSGETFSCAALSACSVGGLLDVTLAGGVSDGQTLVWNSLSSSFVPGNAEIASVCAALASCTLGSIGDVDITGILDGHTLIWDNIAGTFVVGDPSFSCDLSFEIEAGAGISISGTGTPVSDPLVISLRNDPLHEWAWSSSGNVQPSVLGGPRRYAVDYPVHLTDIGVSLGTAGTSSTTVQLYRNGAVLHSVTLLSGENYDTDSLSYTVSPGQYVELIVSAAGAGASDISAQILYSRDISTL